MGSTVVDERLQQSITFRNNGALGTNYRLVKTSLLRSEQTAKEEKPNQKEEVQSEVSQDSLQKDSTTVSG